MAERERNDENTTNWWGSWVTSAKAKSASVFEAVKKDLDEISTAVRTEVTNAGTAIGETLKLDEPESTANTVKKSLSTFFGQVTDALIPSLDEDDAVEAVLITTDGIVTLTGFQKHLAELQANSNTYLQSPDKSLTENYKRWMEVIEQDQFTQNRLAKHLATSEILNEKYLSLVPDEVAHMEFWQRYLFKRAMLEDALANAEIAERKANAELESTKPVSPRKKSIIQTEQPKKIIDHSDLDVETVETGGKSSNENITWESEDFGNVEISEEEQARLLQEYDNEIQEREMRKSLIVPLEEKLKQEEAERAELESKNTAVTLPNKLPSRTSNKNEVKKLLNDSKKGPNTNDKKNTNSNKQHQKQGKHVNPSKQIINKEQLDIQSDHFTTDTAIASDEIASNSDESWEKDFDISEK